VSWKKNYRLGGLSVCLSVKIVKNLESFDWKKYATDQCLCVIFPFCSASRSLVVRLSTETAKLLSLFCPLIELGDFTSDDRLLGCHKMLK